MDCTQAQQILSEAVDRESVSPEVFAEVRTHCTECADCARFVQGLALLQRAQAPAVPTSLHARVMAAVEAERAANATHAPSSESGAEDVLPSAAAAASSASGTSPAEVVALAGEAGVEPTPEAIEHVPAPGPVAPDELSAARRRARQRSMLAWAGAAAAVLIVAAFAAVSGLRSIVSPTATSTRSSFAPGESTSDKNLDASVPGSAGVATAQPQGGSAESRAAQPAVAPDFITVNDIVYRFVETLAIDRSQLTTAGTTSSALGTSGAPEALTVYSTPTSGQVALTSDGATLAFRIVTRLLGGQAYALTSAPIPAFGLWPSLPSGFIEPTTADGAPTFVTAEKDDLGVQVYSRPGIPVTDGFAIAPGTAESDPAQGNPNWTWWTRTAQ